jgi:hypothetical protein
MPDGKDRRISPEFTSDFLKIIDMVSDKRQEAFTLLTAYVLR